MNRIMAIDYGERRIGIALTDPLKIFSKPYLVLENKGKKLFLEELEEIIKEQNVSEVILGYPLGESGQITKKTAEIEKLHKFLSNNLSVEIILHDERFSTIDANEELKKLGYNYMDAKKVIDMVAASMILKSYLKMIG
ncbi:MAG: Holliday junction resolvase RuvX [Candidatus Cloacimonadales bacterium]